MKLLWREEEHIRLLTQIRRSYGALRRRLSFDNWVETDLFKFKKLDQDEFNKERATPRIWSALFSVVVKSTGEKYLVTRYWSFGKDEWSLYQEE